MNLTVIIPVYNDWERLGLCLDCLAPQIRDRDGSEVVVIDNGSAMSVPESFAERYSFTRFLSETSSGSYYARNHGLRESAGRVLAFTDSDCLPAPDWIDRGLAAIERWPEVGLVAGRIAVFPANPARPSTAELLEIATAFRQDEYVRNRSFGATANVFTRREVFDRVGVFNSQLRSGGDSEWGMRVAQAGLEVRYDADVVVCHPARASMKDILQKKRRVVGGADRFTGEQTGRRTSWARAAFNNLIPHVGQARRNACQPGLDRSSYRFRVAGATLYAQYAMLFERIRLVFGGERRR